MRRIQVPSLFEALEKVKVELDDPDLSKRSRQKLERFYGELIEEINSRCEAWVDEPRYEKDVDRGRV